MTNVHGIHPAAAPKPVAATTGVVAGNPKVEPPGISDMVEISEVAKLASKIDEIPQIRTELVERVKTEIVAGTYETSERLEITVERLMEEFFPQS